MADEQRTLNELLDIVLKNECIENAQFKIQPISVDGANYTSKLYVIIVTSPGREVINLFAKVASGGEEFRRVIRADKLYDNERFVYEELNKIYEELQRRSDVPENERLKFSKYYACGNKEEALILENLTAKGYTCYDRFKSVTWEYAAAAVNELAKLHALSYAFAEDDPDGFAKVVSERRSLFDGSSDQIKEMWKKSEANALHLVPENLKIRLVAFLSKESGLDNFEKYFSSFRRPVLVHGDYRSSNLFHRRKNGKLDSLIPIDYQMFHAGTPIIDLLYFIITGTDGEFRKYHYKHLIDHYYDTFASFLKKLALDSEKLYPREHFDEDLKRTLPWGMLVAVYFLPLNLVEAEKALTLDGNPSMVNAVQSNDLYKNRLLELIKDYTEWGIM